MGMEGLVRNTKEGASTSGSTMLLFLLMLLLDVKSDM